MLRDDPEQYNRMVRTMTRRQNGGHGRQARSIVGGGNEGGVVEPDIAEQGAGGQARVQEEEGVDIVEAGVVRGEADAEANNEEEAAAVDGGGPDDVQGEVDAEADNEEEAAVAEYETDFRPSSPVSFSREAFYRAPVAPSQSLVRRMLCKLSPQLKTTI